MYLCHAILSHLYLNLQRPKMPSLNRDEAPPRITEDKNFHFTSIIQVQLNISTARKVLQLHFCLHDK